MSTYQQDIKRHRFLKTLLALLIIASIIIVVIILLLLVAQQSAAIPEFEITDINGDWQAQGTVAVFDNKIKPGDSGEYEFIISNIAEARLRYYIDFDESYSNENWTSFMQYRVKMNGKCLDTEEWRSVDELIYEGIVILPTTKQLFTLEWRWAFESGKDDNDTYLGDDAGTYSITFNLHAEVIEEVVE